MRRHLFLPVAIIAFVGIPEAARPAGDDNAAATRKARAAIARGLAFLEKDAAKWRKERKCATCHHGTMTLFAYSEAKLQGYAVKPETAAETFKWAKERWMERADKPRDKRPGWKMVSTPLIYFALTAQFVPGQKAISAEDLKRIAGHLLRHQEADGSWAWSSAPLKNRPPPFFESDEVATRLVTLALQPAATKAKNKPAVRGSLAKAAAWLKKTKPADTTQAAALRLLMSVRAGTPAETVHAATAKFFQRQNKDGGWGQLRGLPSDGYATGQALYILRLAGVKPDRTELRRGVAFLVASQRPDGSWPMKNRSHPGATPMKSPVPITYFGSAWATLGLMRCVPAAGR
jgi:Squalene-hopene cyclase N-terminal domain